MTPEVQKLPCMQAPSCLSCRAHEQDPDTLLFSPRQPCKKMQSVKCRVPGHILRRLGPVQEGEALQPGGSRPAGDEAVAVDRGARRPAHAHMICKQLQKGERAALRMRT